jgi:acetyltransferase-like isoleucine patch superfamily enzyme
MKINYFRRIKFLIKGYKLGKNVYFGKNVIIKAAKVTIEDDCFFGDNVKITAEIINIQEQCLFFSNTTLHANKEIIFGKRCKLSRNCKWKANHISIGNELWANRNIDVGGGGWNNPRGNLIIGNNVHIGNTVHINVCEPVTIEGKSGIGMECMIFTHSSGNGQNIFDGYPSISLPVTIKQCVSLYSRVIVAPGVTIGEGVTIGANSYVGKNIQEKALYAGTPCILRKDYIPLSIDEGFKVINIEIQKYTNMIFEDQNSYLYNYHGEYILFLKEFNNEKLDLYGKYPINVLICCQNNNCSVADDIAFFNLKNQTVCGYSSKTSEKIRDILRRLGIIIEIRDYYKLEKLSAEKLIMYNIEEY